MMTLSLVRVMMVLIYDGKGNAGVENEKELAIVVTRSRDREWSLIRFAAFVLIL